jgi:predicted O-methyltransferase YrrM
MGHDGEQGALLEHALRHMRTIDGWFDEAEARLLFAMTIRALAELPEPSAVVEVGSWCGRSTVVLGAAVRASGTSARVFAVDPHEGEISLPGANGTTGRYTGPSTFDRFLENMNRAGLRHVVRPLRQRSFEVAWSQPISLLLIDGLHDEANVARDLGMFEPWLVEGGFVAFHDYTSFAGVAAVADRLLAGGRYRPAGRAGTLLVVQRHRRG